MPDILTINRERTPAWFWGVAGLGIAWNAFGVVQLVDFASQTHESLMMKGMSSSAADLYYALPFWMKLVFGLGAIGGFVGSVLLALRREAATPVLAASLVGYIALFVGDYLYGVFAVIEGQLFVLLVVVTISTVLLGVAVATGRRVSKSVSTQSRTSRSVFRLPASDICSSRFFGEVRLLDSALDRGRLVKSGFCRILRWQADCTPLAGFIVSMASSTHVEDRFATATHRSRKRVSRNTLLGSGSVQGGA